MAKETYDLSMEFDYDGAHYYISAHQDCSASPAIRNYCDSEITDEGEIEFDNAFVYVEKIKSWEKVKDVFLADALFERALELDNWE